MQPPQQRRQLVHRPVDRALGDQLPERHNPVTSHHRLHIWPRQPHSRTDSSHRAIATSVSMSGRYSAVRAIRATNGTQRSRQIAFSPSRSSSAPLASTPAVAHATSSVRLVLAAENPPRPEDSPVVLPPSLVTK